jgi:transcriptional regulator of heat shock response
MITNRQEKLLNFLIKEYIGQAKPVSSKALKKACSLDVCGATIRNDLQVLTEEGFITQPHISAGRIPTRKAYKYIADKLEKTATFYDVHEVNVVRMSIVRQINEAHEEMEREMRHMQEIMQALEQDDMFNILNILDKWHRNQI